MNEKYTLKHILSAIKHRIIHVYLFVKYFFVELFTKTIYVCYQAQPYHLNLMNRNFGDDINMIVVNYLSKRLVVPYNYSIIARMFHRKKFMVIGSVITMNDLSNTIIWGSGVLSSRFTICNNPISVCAVRGPLSRDYLLERNIQCPDVYGDPALLLPDIYNPKTAKKYKVGIIAHYLDHMSVTLRKILEKYPDDIVFIDVTNYGTWQKFIDTIKSCHCILSSSLHGLIVSDAYDIPNRWIEFDFKMDDGGFKFRDYFLSVQRKVEPPYVLKFDMQIEELSRLCGEYQCISFDKERLLNSCPFLKKS